MKKRSAKENKSRKKINHRDRLQKKKKKKKEINETLIVENTQKDERSRRQLKSKLVENIRTMEDIPTISYQAQSMSTETSKQSRLSAQPERIYARRQIESKKIDARDPLYVTLTADELSSFETVEVRSKVKHADERFSYDQKLTPTVNKTCHVVEKTDDTKETRRNDIKEETEKDNMEEKSIQKSEKVSNI
ncbi:unnamed protein product [Cercopithifilaria johnstoni]|uniref:Uncharacterized protein n=1 Tax=Cercopithifilaria johnstoni TaxID=2874296 RepID=A0A8J2M2F6_9BILA|nr:unnamed protein product [Cercopithifilaria johnstoni]